MNIVRIPSGRREVDTLGLKPKKIKGHGRLNLILKIVFFMVTVKGKDLTPCSLLIPLFRLVAVVRPPCSAKM